MQVALATQPESIDRLVWRSLKLYVKGLPRVFFFSLVLSIIVFIPRLSALIYAKEFKLSLITQSTQVCWLILIEIGVLFIFTSMLWRIRCVLYQEHESIFSDMKIAIKKLPLVLAAAFIQIAFFAILMTIAFVFGFYLTQYEMMASAVMQSQITFFAAALLALNFWFIIYVYYLVIFYLPLILTEDKGIIASLKQSIFLVWSKWWRTFLFLLIPWFFYVVGLIIIRKMFNVDLHIYFIEPVIQSTWPAVITHILIFAIFVPWVASALLIQLRDLELRKKVG
jgi:hypothetical protein